MSVRAVVGLQWGDEGKGKIIDFLSTEADVVARSQGGPNAGHTVVVNGETAVFHLLPCGILHPHTTCVVGNGVVVDPAVLEAELAYLDAHGISWKGRVLLSHAAHVIFPYHRMLDLAWEKKRAARSIGTTGRGIGPAYVDKVSRVGLRLGDLRNPGWFRERLLANIEEKEALLEWLGFGEPLEHEAVIASCLAFGDKMASWIIDTSRYLNEALDAGKRVLFEGAQGTLLDLDHGTYPYVTSSSPLAGGVGTGCGVGPTRIESVFGVAKAYTTRVGNGPFPTELPDLEAERLRGLGEEFGATTGRPRRCGWLDAVLLRYGVVLNQVTHMAITKLDVLDTLPELRIATAYRVKGEVTRHPPMDPWMFEHVEPVYETHPGWLTRTSGAKRWGDLPAAARRYLDRIEELAGARVDMVSVGSGRDMTLHRD